MAEYIEVATVSQTKNEMRFTMKDVQLYLYGKKTVQLIDTTKLQKERIKHLQINKEPRGNSWCDICNESPEECPMHGPLHSLRKLVNQSEVDSSIIDYSAILKFPDEVGLCSSSIPGIEYGVCAKAAIPSGTWIGPYEGRLVRPEQITGGRDTEYMWEIFHDGQVSHYLDARDESNSSWMRFIRCARDSHEQNMVIFQYHGCIYYRTTRDVKLGEELLVWYDSRYTLILGIPVALNEAGSKGVNPPRGIVTQERSYSKRHQENAQRNKRKLMDKEGEVESKTSKLMEKATKAANELNTVTVKQETTARSSFNYRNSMYHRGRWYKLKKEESHHQAKRRCGKCRKEFVNQELFLLHLCDQKNYSCENRDHMCSSKHVEDHVTDRPYKCRECPRRFNSNIELSLHMRIHAHRHVSPRHHACDDT